MPAGTPRAIDRARCSNRGAHTVRRTVRARSSTRGTARAAHAPAALRCVATRATPWSGSSTDRTAASVGDVVEVRPGGRCPTPAPGSLVEVVLATRRPARARGGTRAVTAAGRSGAGASPRSTGCVRSRSSRSSPTTSAFGGRGAATSASTCSSCSRGSSSRRCCSRSTRTTARSVLGAFWGRRARRLLPALFCMVTAVMVYVVARADTARPTSSPVIDLHALRARGDRDAAVRRELAGHHRQQHSYFAQFSAPSPLQHTWSLAIEEQFYLLWPFVTARAARQGAREPPAARSGGLGRHRRCLDRAHGGALRARNRPLARLLRDRHEDRGPRRRRGARLADRAAARDARRVSRAALRFAAPLALAGLLALMVTAGTARAAIPDDFMFQGGFLLASVLCAIVIADVRREGSVLARGSRWRPVVAVGPRQLRRLPVALAGHRPASPASAPGSSGAGLLVGAPRAHRRARRSRATTSSSCPCGDGGSPCAVRMGRLPARRRGHRRGRVHRDDAVARRQVPRARDAAALRAGRGDPRRGRPRGPGTHPRLRTPIDAAHPLRVVLVGDSMFGLSGPGVVAALEATGEVAATNFGFPGWATSTIPYWRGYVRHAVASTHADVVMLHDELGRQDRRRAPGGLPSRVLEQLVSVARSAGAVGRRVPAVPEDPPAPRRRRRTALSAATARQVAAWNAAVAVDARAAAGPARCTSRSRPGVELNGRFSPWIPPPRDPNAAACDVGPRPPRRRRAPVPAGHRRCTPRPSLRTPRRAGGCPSRRRAGG